jgi:hypothetical protein
VYRKNNGSEVKRRKRDKYDKGWINKQYGKPIQRES